MNKCYQRVFNKEGKTIGYVFEKNGKYEIVSKEKATPKSQIDWIEEFHKGLGEFLKDYLYCGEEIPALGGNPCTK